MTTALRNSEVASAVVNELAGHGVSDAIVSPGSRNTPLLLALAHSNIRVHVITDERAASFFGLGLAKAQRRPVVLNCTSGSAGANYTAAMAEACYAGVPLIAVTADRPAQLQGCGAPQTMNQKELFGHFAVSAIHLEASVCDEEGKMAAGATRELFEGLRAHIGPAHLNVAFQEPLWSPETPSKNPTASVTEPPVHLTGTDRVPAQIFENERGVFLCGPETVFDAGSRDRLARVAKRLGWPILAEAASGVRYGVEHESVICSYEALIRGGHLDALIPDTIIRLGRTSTAKPVAQWLAKFARDKLVLINPNATPQDPDKLAAAHYRADIETLCSVAETAVVARENQDWYRRWIALNAMASSAMRPVVENNWWEGYVAHHLVQRMPAGGVLHVASSMPIRDLDAFCPNMGRHIRVFANRGLNGIDGTLATAAGEATAHANRPIAVLIGDLAFLYDASSLPLLSSQHATVVVVDNGGGGIFEFLPISGHPTEFERLFLTPPREDVERIARAYGARVHIADSTQTLSDALASSLETKGLDVIVAKVDRKANVQLHRDAWSRASAMGRLGHDT